MGMIAAIVCGTAFAGNLNEIKASAVSDDDLSTSTPDKIVSTFYGSKASTNANNPCKGATIRKCGTIESSLVSFEDQTLVMQQVKDAVVTHYLQTISLLHLPCQKQRQILSLKQ